MTWWYGCIYTLNANLWAPVRFMNKPNLYFYYPNETKVDTFCWKAHKVQMRWRTSLRLDRMHTSLWGILFSVGQKKMFTSKKNVSKRRCVVIGFFLFGGKLCCNLLVHELTKYYYFFLEGPNIITWSMRHELAKIYCTWANIRNTRRRVDGP